MQAGANVALPLRTPPGHAWTRALRRRGALILGGLISLLVSTPVRTLADPRALFPRDLRCESLREPLGIEEPAPRLTWSVEGRGHDRRQTAWRILVATTSDRLRSGHADLWDSGKHAAGEDVHVTYAGRALVTGQRCHWKVRVWDEADRASDWSEPSAWEMGVIRPEDWQAVWIGAGPEKEPRPPHGFFRSTNELAQVATRPTVDGRSVLLRREFTLRPALRRARAYVSGLGLHELHCNGRKVDDRVLAPSKSNYRQWVFYDTYDLTPLLRTGTNALGLMLGNGWFNPAQKWWEPYRMQWFGSPRACLQLRVEYTDGTSEWVVSDSTWKTRPGPVLASCIYDGETYDATEEQPGWAAPGFDSTGWIPARVVEPPGGRMVSQLMPPMRVTELIRPRTLRSPRPGVHVVDLGHNISGWIRLKVDGPRGTRITLRYAEDCHPDGSLDPRSNERALATDTFVLRGGGRETFEPHFTYHGFRYVEITGHPGTPSLADIVGCFVHTDCSPTGSFACGNELVNRLHRATVRSQRGCMLGYPADCPQRDERLGWLGDALVSADEMLLNFDATVFLRQWLEGIRFNQNPANGDISIVSPRPYTPEEPDPTWSSAYPILVWELYRQQGDRRLLADHFDAVCRFVDYLGTQATHHILPRYWIGDWGSIVEGWKEGDPPSVTTGFYFLDATLAARMARVLDRPEAASRYAHLARDIRVAFRRQYHDAARHRFDQGTLFSNAFPLVLGLAEPDETGPVLRNILADLDRQGGRFDVGVLGAKYLPEALTLGGRPDRAYALATQTGYPSWAHMLEGGRDTLSEFWDLHGSHNHVMMGSIDAWFYRALAGIVPDDARPGYRHVVIRPFPPADLNHVETRVQTVRGPIAVSWERIGSGLRLEVELPPSVEATVHVPAAPGARVRAHPSRAPERRESDRAIFRVGSGRYLFRVRAGGGSD